jgi:hypothetical protein
MVNTLKAAPIQIVCLIISLNLLCSCSGSESRGIIGGPCEYQTFPGTAQFTELKSVTDGFEVYYDFILSDPTVSLNYIKNNGKNLQFATWDNAGWHTVFTTEWLTSNGISVGVAVPAEYKEIIHGSCSPAIISFPTITGASF